MHSNIVQWLEITAGKFPYKTAITDGSVSYTWQEVRQRALSIADNIEKVIRVRKQPVAVYMEKTADMVIALLGVAYSGNFYTVVASDMPQSRIEKILTVLKPSIFISKGELINNIETSGAVNFTGPVLNFDDIISSEIDNIGARRYVDRILDTDLLYVLFTSGSTGMPKGVSINHRSVIDYIEWVVNEFSITEKDSFGNQAPFYFDNSVLDIYSTIKTGAELYVIPENLFHQAPHLLQYLVDNRITTIFWVPSALSQTARTKAFESVDLRNTLKRVLFAGEVMPAKLLNVWRRKVPDAVYANLYGPTEITVDCTFYVIDREFNDDESIPIGAPMRNTEVLVLDENDKLVTESGQIGELCVRGTCLAAGYYNNPEKTAEVFVQNPLQSAYEEKIYRTGDLVKYNERQELIYISRKDSQIKHLGHRIELGEIETAVSSLNGVTACCCLYNHKKGLIVLFLEGIEITRNEINEKLAALLPRYMLPSKVICLNNLPLNANGKIDRVKLREDYVD